MSSPTKSTVVSRGLTYSYQHIAPSDPAKPYLLFLHGFPSTHRDWRVQIAFFAARGYGILAPDMLGAGGTARPAALADWRLDLMARDLADVLDAERISDVVGVAHDWGCVALSRLAVLYPARVRAYVWLGHPFIQPAAQAFDLQAVMRLMKDYLGYEGFSYWEFFARADAPEVIAKHPDSFLQLLYPKDAADWLTYMALPGKTAEWMDSDKQPGYPTYIDEEDIAALKANIAAGIGPSLNWYRAQMANVDLEDNTKIPTETYALRRPSFFAVALRDCICTPKWGNAQMDQYGGGPGAEVTRVEYDTGHWVQLEAADKVNADVAAWLDRVLA